MKNFLIICAILGGLTSCEKTAGEGGTSKIEGGVIYFAVTYNQITFENDTHFYPKSGKDVYIIYDDNESEVYDDEFETDYNGKYHFEYLRKGKYTIYTHKDTTIVIGPGTGTEPATISYDIPVFKSVNITSNNSTNKVDDFVIEKNNK